MEAVEEVLRPNSQKYDEIINTIESHHLKASREAISGPDNAKELLLLEQEVKAECSRLRSFMSAAEVLVFLINS